MPAMKELAGQNEDKRKKTIDDILDAVELFSVGDVRNFTLRDLAERSGYSTSILYSHFPSKQGIIEAALERRLARYLRQYELAIDQLELPATRASVEELTLALLRPRFSGQFFLHSRISQQVVVDFVLRFSNMPLALFQKQSERGILLLSQSFRYLARRIGASIDEDRLTFWCLTIVGHARIRGFGGYDPDQHDKFILMHAEQLVRDLFPS